MTEVRSFEFRPLAVENWSDFEALFGANGACGGCWCMWFRLTNREFETSKGAQNRSAMRRLVERGEQTGIVAYEGDRPVGWVSLAPRGDFGRLGRSRILKPVDDVPVWSVVCFYIAREARRRGLSVALLEAAADHARAAGASVLEGYPVEPRSGSVPDVFAYYGLASAFEKAGFSECARRSETRPIMRRSLA